ncbi:hypothetical protein KKC08_02560 [Patescibacteria group bacterium]|nr:hypothetical protein [Patescibacteria group bacterium]MCG2702712.1 hypothetical protein [Candidatus Parcubacteria bacterium]MBU4265053.1 hypothetical protein [Patescibacteria group bacterium]MBU4390206.1 hypothetical protein [Patescibacteria group bacterium]MBU4397021.1 hypothetical protein [Patescibacteria group bacterium]
MTKKNKKETFRDRELTDLNEEKELFAWEASERAFKKKDKDFWITSIAILGLVSVILFFAKEFFLVVALGAVLFLYYVLSTVEPKNTKNKLTNRGVYFGELFYPWTDLHRFWFGKSLDCEALFFETNLRFPREFCLIIDKKNEEKIKKIVVKRLPLIEISPRFIDKASEWLAKKLPLEERKN